MKLSIQKHTFSLRISYVVLEEEPYLSLVLFEYCFFIFIYLYGVDEHLPLEVLILCKNGQNVTNSEIVRQATNKDMGSINVFTCVLRICFPALDTQLTTKTQIKDKMTVDEERKDFYLHLRKKFLHINSINSVNAFFTLSICPMISTVTEFPSLAALTSTPNLVLILIARCF